MEKDGLVPADAVPILHEVAVSMSALPVSAGRGRKVWLTRLRHKLQALVRNVEIGRNEPLRKLCNIRELFEDSVLPFYPSDIQDDIKRNIQRVTKQIDELIDGPKSTDQVETTDSASIIIFQSEEIKKVLELIDRLAKEPNIEVVILGETGVGKELAARRLHDRSPRRELPYVALNCAACPVNLLESELFGYAKGAFTDAKADKPGLLEAVDGGTLFLDEIGELDLSLQAKLLRVIQYKAFRRVGETKERSFQGHIIAATNKNLKEEIERGRFRRDLYYRLATVPILIPPLRERISDLDILTAHFLSEINPNVIISQDALDRLRTYSFPGNVRELKAILIRAYILATLRHTNANRIIIAPEHLTFDTLNNGDLRIDTAESARTISELISSVEEHGLHIALRLLEKELIEEILRRTNGDKNAAAVFLKIHRISLARKLGPKLKGK